ncbi:hypothetical protein HDN1F_35140 [gamma proteobacterium HdN1]|nr:hypothetical protein HDN1F_18040 [gamma proteobacterium HdN1]CBL47097.1 hypothetical protein HDN1F_35140 [gamma proteobacterium HdN1]
MARSIHQSNHQSKSKYKKYAGIPLLLFGLSTVTLAADRIEVTYFGNDQYPPQQVEWAKAQPDLQVVIVNLDDHRNLENELSKDLPNNDPEKAMAIARERVLAVEQARWDTLFSGPIKAKEWQVQRIPAVVFGQGKQVVYGVTDLQKAVGEWRGVHLDAAHR